MRRARVEAAAAAAEESEKSEGRRRQKTYHRGRTARTLATAIRREVRTGRGERAVRKRGDAEQ